MTVEIHKNYSQQVLTFKSRGMIVDENTESYLKKISYYKLKRIANFFMIQNQVNISLILILMLS